MKLNNSGNIVEYMIAVVLMGAVFLFTAYYFYAGITGAGGIGLFWAGLSIISKIFAIAWLLFAGFCLTGIIVSVRQWTR